MCENRKIELTKYYENNYKKHGVDRFKLFAKLDCLDFSLNFEKIFESIKIVDKKEMV